MQRAILQVGVGPFQGTKRVLSPGEKLSVGKRGRADFGLRDKLISPLHFEVSWDGTTCTLKDLKSRHGTFLSGDKVKTAELRNAAWIRAGSSDFFLFLEEATPPPVDPEVALLDAEEDDV